jgi:hypothetical protein
MNTSPLKIGCCLSLPGALASNGKTAQLAHVHEPERRDQEITVLAEPVGRAKR